MKRRLNARQRNIVKGLVRSYGFVLNKITVNDYLLFRARNNKTDQLESFKRALNKNGLQYKKVRDNGSEFVIKLWPKGYKDASTSHGFDVCEFLGIQKSTFLNEVRNRDDYARLTTISNVWFDLMGLLKDVRFTFSAINEPQLSEIISTRIEFLNSIQENFYDNINNIDIEVFLSSLNKILDIVSITKRKTIDLISNQVVTGMYDEILPFINYIPDDWDLIREQVSMIWSDFAEEFDNEINKYGNIVKVSFALSSQSEPVSDIILEILYEMAKDDGNIRFMLNECEADGIRPKISKILDDRIFHKLDSWPGGFRENMLVSYYMYLVDNTPIMVMDNYLVSNNEEILNSLSESDMSPKMSSNCSLVRVTFTVNASMDPMFLDYLRSIGANRITKNTFDIPYRTEFELDEIMNCIDENFGHSIQIFEILDGYLMTGSTHEEIVAKTRSMLFKIRLLDKPIKHSSRPTRVVSEKLSSINSRNIKTNKKLQVVSSLLNISRWAFVFPKNSFSLNNDFIEIPMAEGENVWVPEGMGDVVNETEIQLTDFPEKFLNFDMESVPESSGFQDQNGRIKVWLP